MTAAIITIGDEILIGQTIDTNSGFIAKALDNIGVQTIEMISIGDSHEHIISALSSYQDKVGVVIVTGGLGPTKDDITKKTFCHYFEDSLIVDEKVLAHVTKMIENFFRRPITQLNKDQALVPSKAVVLHNEFGTAPGLWMSKGKTIFISLPGVPYEMKGLVDSEVIPKLSTQFERPYIIHKNIMTYGLGESLLAERIANWEESLPEMIKLAYLPSPGKVKLRLTARGKDKDLIQKAVDKQVNLLKNIIGDIIVGYDENETIEIAIAKLLSESGFTLAMAESCTGGKIAQMVTAIPGSSAFFKGSIVAYQTETKTSVLGIPPPIIEKYTVVSKEVASAMALAAKKLFNADYAISTTGNAGPSKGDSDAELGRVFIAIATPEKVIAEQYDFGQPREKVIARAANKALEMLRQEILKNVP